MAAREQTYTADTHEPIITQALTRAYTLNWYFVAYALILVLAITTRFVDLGARVMSHDESLHTYYSWRLYEFGEFSHTPLMHGPVLFHMVALSYFLFGDSDFTARIYPATLGVLMVLYPFLLRRWLGRTGALIASALLLISPQIMYYNRYIREDTPSLFFTLMMVYALLQYIDGERPRRPIWLWVLSGSLLLSLASKEVAFMYIAIFGSFLVLIWLLRMTQDIGIQRRPADSSGWQAPLFQLFVGHAILYWIVSVVSLAMGGLLRTFLWAERWMPTDTAIATPLFFIMYVPLALAGFIRNGTLWSWLIRVEEKPKRGERAGGVASAIMQGLAHGRSALMVITAGLIVGALLALLIVCVLDVIKPQQIWPETSVRSDNDMMTGANISKEFAISRGFDSAMFVRLLTWIGIPVVILLFVLFLTAVFKYPGDVPLPWREFLLIVLIAFIATNALVLFERHSHVETDQTPFAADPTAVAKDTDGEYNNNWIIAAWVVGIVVTAGVAGSRLLTNWWDFLNRQPLFDVLIVIGSMALPWLAGYPLWRAGYNLEDYNSYSKEGRATLEAALWIVLPFFMISASVGLSWNWKRWLPACAVFLGLFGFFFTTVFSNQYGLVTGMIGSLGYWLEQQGVRRGSQPQYYYVLTQLPVYEFLPLIGAMLAGVTGLSSLWKWRRERTVAALRARYEPESPSDDENRVGAGFQTRPEGEATHELPDIPLPDESFMRETQVAGVNRTEAFAMPGLLPGVESLEWDWPDPDTDPDTQPIRPVFAPLPPRLARPFSEEEENERRRDPEWIGAFPFLMLLGWWAIMILFSLTMAGEKMPWLTTHLTVPLILITGWWLGGVIQKINWRALGVTDWLTLIVVLPLAFMAFAQVVVSLWGANPPFQGFKMEDLLASGNWFAAVLVFAGTLYMVGRFANHLGWRQLGYMALISGMALLAILTARVAYYACFINYDYATEFLVYAHGGPAVKTVLNEVDRIAEITNEGANMRIVFDDESSWPLSWYFRDYTNYGFIRGEAGSVDPTSLDGARVVVVGNKKAGDVRRILGDRYYEFGYIRLWWPMQEYFGLTYERVTNVFSTSGDNVAARYYREGIWDIWWDRDYRTYAQAMCIEAKQYRCEQETQWGTTDEEKDVFRTACQNAIVNECLGEDLKRFDPDRWPVSDRLYFFVDKQVAARVWDAGIGSSNVNIREPEYPEDLVYRDITAETALGATASMVEPRGIVVDDAGQMYIADTRRSRVVVLNPAGEVVQIIGEMGAVPGDIGLREPWGLDIGPDGNLYIADTWNNRVAVYTPDGEFVRAWGHEGRPYDDPALDALWGPRDLKIGPDGYVYVADTGGKRIRVYTTEGAWVRDIGTGGSGPGQLDEPVGLAFNPISGELYVAEAWNRRIQTFDRGGLPVRTFSVNMWFTNRQSPNRPYLAISPDGTLIYVTDMDDRHRVVAYNLIGQPVFSFNQPDNLVTGLLGLRAPAGLAFDASGRLYVLDSNQSKVFVFPPSQISGGIAPIAPAADQPFPPEWNNATPQEDTSTGDATPLDVPPLNDSGGDAVEGPPSGRE
jgi:predicted membrane-bound mannosyltransferase/DNA-binding beta-propeller fold protein YncE